MKMKTFLIGVVIFAFTITFASSQLNFGENKESEGKTPDKVDSRLGLLASTLGVAPVPGASYGPDKGSNFEGDGTLGGGGGIHSIPAPGDNYGPIDGIGVPAPGDSYASNGNGGIQGGNYNNGVPQKCECVPKEHCLNRPGSGHNGGIQGGNSGGNYPEGKDPGLTIGNGPNNNPDIDGSGVIDIRIVNKPPSGVICLAGDIYCCNKGSTPVIQPSGPENPYSCGVSSNIPVPGFQPEYGHADFGEYPWMAVILSESNNYLGAGALLDSYHILTAAHKIADYKSGLKMKVRLGEWNAQDDSEPFKNVEIQVADVNIHPSFNSQNLQNDVAIVKLKQPVDIGAYPHIKPACLPNQGSDFVGKRCWVAGFGKDAFKVGKHSYYLKEVDVPIVDSNECEGRLRGTRLGNYFTLNRKSFLCAGGEDGKDACTGDGGAPLVCKGYDGYFQVVGLVAWGIGCAEYGVPGVYVNVPNFVDWIQTKLY